MMFCEKAAECGHRSFVVMAGALDGLEVKAEELSHQGTFGVGYGVCTFEAKGIAPQREFLRKYEKKIKKQAKEKRNKEDAYVGLARKTIETYVRTGEMISLPTDLPEEMYHRKAGVFVSRDPGKCCQRCHPGSQISSGTAGRTGAPCIQCRCSQ